MRLNVAVQMDPIERINIRGDSTFALLLEAQARGHALFYYTPDRLVLRDGKVSAAVRPREGARYRRRPFHARRAADRRPRLLRRGAAAAGSAVRSGLHLDHPHARSHPPEDAGGQRSGHVRNAPEKVFVTEFPELMPPTLITRDLDAIKAFRAEHERHRHEAALRPRRRGGFPAGRATTSISVRSTICSPTCFASRGWCRNSCRR